MLLRLFGQTKVDICLPRIYTAVNILPLWIKAVNGNITSILWRGFFLVELLIFFFILSINVYYLTCTCWRRCVTTVPLWRVDIIVHDTVAGASCHIHRQMLLDLWTALSICICTGRGELCTFVIAIMNPLMAYTTPSCKVLRYPSVQVLRYPSVRNHLS